MRYIYIFIVGCLLMVSAAFAATFDADLLPGATNNYDIGLSSSRWKNLFLSGNLVVGNTLTLGNLSVEPSGLNGMLYYNSSSNIFRGFRNGAWADVGYWNLSGNDIYSNVSGNVGIGNPSPSEKLTVTGNASVSGSISSASLNVSGTAQLGGFKMTTGAVQGKVLTSDASGVGTWQTPTGEGIPPGYSILGDTTASPTGYAYTGDYVEAKGTAGAGIWATKANMPTARSYFTAVSANNKIYAIGGSGYSTVNEEYDPATNTWTTKSNMPTGREQLAAAAVNNKIYAIGGGNEGGCGSQNEEYNPTTNTWTTKANMPTGRCQLAAAAVNNKIYAIGGISSSGSLLSTNEEYDPATNVWTTKANMPTARRNLAAAATNDKIYAIGGNSGPLLGNMLSANEEYDSASNTWATKANMPTARTALAAASIVNNKIYAIGGAESVGYSSKNEEYDPTTNTWATKANMPTARRMLAAAAVNNKIYAIGGVISGPTISSANEEYNPIVTKIYHIHKKN